MRPVGWAVVGCGWVGRAFAAPALVASPACRLVALCDANGAALADVSAPADTLRTTDLDAALTDDVEAVYVCTPNHTHRPLASRALAAGKHVLVEKPTALNAADAGLMYDAAARAGRLLATAYDQRFHAAHSALRRMIAAGAFGPVTLVRIHYACWTAADWQPDDVRGTAAAVHDNWRVDPARAGGGALIDLAPHGLDLVQWLLGEPIETLHCLLQRRVHTTLSIDDGATIAARTTGGTLVAHSVAYNCPEAFPRRTLEVVGTRARALLTNTMGQTPGGTFKLTHADGRVEDVDFSRDDVSPFLAQVEAFSACVRSNALTPHFDPARERATMRLLDLARQQNAEAPWR